MGTSMTNEHVVDMLQCRTVLILQMSNNAINDILRGVDASSATDDFMNHVEYQLEEIRRLIRR